MAPATPSIRKQKTPPLDDGGTESGTLARVLALVGLLTPSERAALLERLGVRP